MTTLRIEHQLQTRGGLCAAAFDGAGQLLALGEWGGGRVLSSANRGVTWEGPLLAAEADEEDAGVASVVCLDDVGRRAAFAMTAHTGATGLDGLFVVDLPAQEVLECPFSEAPLSLRFTRTGRLLVVTRTRVGSLAAGSARVRWLREAWAGPLAVERVLDCTEKGAVTFTVRSGNRRELWRSVASGRRRLATVRGDVRGVSTDGKTAFVYDVKGLRLVNLATGRSDLRSWPAPLGRRPVELHAVSGDGARVVVSESGAASDDAWLLKR